MDNRKIRRNRSSKLFLVRIWTEHGDKQGGESGDIEWHGRVQRVVDGRSRKFEDLQELPALLLAMVAKDEWR